MASHAATEHTVSTTVQKYKSLKTKNEKVISFTACVGIDLHLN
jgi:hypothetical protein